ncbi:hypothetical protein NQ314_015740 [Rhamnusium bicolor]|uniref:Uncharacterized protein n=1 Tax=Rhamnusium bicolor TaxID=1586634 RepID=A0AAV8WYN4_9CUCU|nr:hypothetical protein NQ314_015740 [Rhamnusium bicolor]
MAARASRNGSLEDKKVEPGQNLSAPIIEEMASASDLPKSISKEIPPPPQEMASTSGLSKLKSRRRRRKEIPPAEKRQTSKRSKNKTKDYSSCGICCVNWAHCKGGFLVMSGASVGSAINGFVLPVMQAAYFGSGPSGAVIANRLSEIPEWKVLLIEAGTNASVITNIPFLAGTLEFTDYNWGYSAERQDGFCKGCPDGRMLWPHGKGLGGTTIINYMIHVRGNRRDYDRWRDMDNPGWSYDDVLPYFMKSEDAHIERQDPEYHNKGGYLTVSDVTQRTQSVHAFILINANTKEAYGVKYVRNKKYHTALARKEVILCAGGLNSPQLLMLSGIGPREHLEEVGGVEALAYIRTNVSTDSDASYPDVETYFYWRRSKYGYGILPMLVHPRSYGYIKLKSKNPFHWPKFYANFFTDPDNHDMKTFIAAIREIQRINGSPSLQKYGATLVTTPIPGCENHIFDSDDYWECAIRTITGTLYHQVATCKMGPSSDPEAVVNAKLQVYGIKNLRVADTSIIPLPLTAHTAEPAYMIGEKASDIIKEHWATDTFSDNNIK